MEGFTIGLIYSVSFNILAIWLLSKSERRFRRDHIAVSCTDDIVNLSFGDPIVVLYQVTKILCSFCMLVALNMFLGAQTQYILCQMVKM